MEKGQLRQQLNLNTNGNCFICFRPEREPYPSVHSNPRFPIQTLTGYLDIKPKVKRASQLLNLKSDGVSKIITVSLCASCLQLMTSVFQLILVKQSSDGPLAEVTGMKLAYFLGKLRRTMRRAEGPSGNRMVWFGDQGDIKVAKSLRKEIQKKCFVHTSMSMRSTRVLVTKLDPNWKLERQEIKEEADPTGAQDYEEDNFLSGLNSNQDPEPSPEAHTTVSKVDTELIKTEPEAETGSPGKKMIAHQLQALFYETLRSPSPSPSPTSDAEGDHSEMKSSQSKSKAEVKLKTEPSHKPDNQRLHDGKQFACDQCNKVFRHKKNLREHKFETHDGVYFPCGISGCDKSYPRMRYLKVHQRNKHGVPFQSFEAKKQKTKEERDQKSGPDGAGFLCQECGKEFKSRGGYLMHYKKAHLHIRHKCPRCNRTFTQLGALKRHTLVSGCAAGKPKRVTCSCPTCGKQFALQKYLDKHVKSVHEEAPRCYCDLCDKKFYFGFSLREHQNRVHFRVKFYCDVADCDKSFSGKQAVTLHLINCHGVAPESARDPCRECFGPHPCSICGKRFPTESSLQTHSQSHLKDVPESSASATQAPGEEKGKPSELPTVIAGEELDGQLILD